MRIADADAIRVPENRMRKEFDDGAQLELVRSIASKGLMNPVTVRQVGDLLELVAGERRLRAIKTLIASGARFHCNNELVPVNCAPYLFIGDLSDDLRLEAELEENVIRANLTWVEQVEGRKRLFDLRQRMAAADGRSYTKKDLANELQRAGVAEASQAQVFQQLAVAPFLDRPGVREAGSVKEATKVVAKVIERSITGALGDMLTGAPPPRHTFLQGDALEILPKLPPNIYDCVLTDPPYGIGIDDSGSMVSNPHHYDDSPNVLERILDAAPWHLYRICRQQAHIYWMCDLSWFSKISFALEEAGFRCCRYPIIWWKRGKAMAPDQVRWPKREYECIVFGSKGDRPTLRVAGDVIATSYTSDLQQAEKPKELYVELLSRSIMAGSQVIDPFCGSGVIFDAAEALKCAATGIELDLARGNLAKIRAYGEL